MTNQLHPFHQFRCHLGCAYRHTRSAFFAYPWPFLIVVLLAVVWLFAGCTSDKPVSRPPARPPEPPPAETSRVIEGQKQKDATVAASADQIDKIVEDDASGTTDQAVAEVKTQTDTIRQAVRGDPAEKVVDLANSFVAYTTKVNKVIDRLEADNRELRRLVEEARDATSRRVQFWFGLILRLLAAGLLVVAGLKAYAAISSGIPSLSAVRGSAVTVSLSASAFALSWAVAQWWFYWACGVFVVLFFGTWAAHAYFADRAKGALATLADAIEQGKDDVTSTVAKVDLSKLKDEMTDGAKALIKKTRRGLAKRSAV